MNSITPHTRDPYVVYGEHATRSLAGQLMKFSKGDYLADAEGVPIPTGTVLVALMPSLELGWTLWGDNRPVERRMGYVRDGFQPPPRRELDSTDQKMWVRDKDGKVRDPWAFSNNLTFVDPDDASQAFAFTTSSKGGIRAIGDLAKQYGMRKAENTYKFPVVALDLYSYQHRDKALGRIKAPVFRIVSWVATKPYDAFLTEILGEAFETLAPPARADDPSDALPF